MSNDRDDIDQIIDRMEQYLRKQRNQLVDRQEFHARNQLENESVD